MSNYSSNKFNIYESTFTHNFSPCACTDSKLSKIRRYNEIETSTSEACTSSAVQDHCSCAYNTNSCIPNQSNKSLQDVTIEMNPYRSSRTAFYEVVDSINNPFPTTSRRDTVRSPLTDSSSILNLTPHNNSFESQQYSNKEPSFFKYENDTNDYFKQMQDDISVKSDSINMLSVVVSTIMLLASKKEIPPSYIIWTMKYLKCIKNKQGLHPPNIKKILILLSELKGNKEMTENKVKCAAIFE